MRFVVLRRIELKLGRVVGNGPPRFVVNFSKRPHQRSKVIQRSSCLRNALWLPNLVGKTPDQSVMHCWGQRSCRGHTGQPEVKLLGNANGHQIWKQEPKPEVNCLEMRKATKCGQCRFRAYAATGALVDFFLKRRVIRLV